MHPPTPHPRKDLPLPPTVCHHCAPCGECLSHATVDPPTPHPRKDMPLPSSLGYEHRPFCECSTHATVHPSRPHPRHDQHPPPCCRYKRPPCHERLCHTSVDPSAPHPHEDLLPPASLHHHCPPCSERSASTAMDPSAPHLLKDAPALRCIAGGRNPPQRKHSRGDDPHSLRTYDLAELAERGIFFSGCVADERPRAGTDRKAASERYQQDAPIAKFRWKRDLGIRRWHDQGCLWKRRSRAGRDGSLGRDPSLQASP